MNRSKVSFSMQRTLTIFIATLLFAGTALGETVLYNFQGQPDGANPSVARLTLGKNGVLYGTTPKGGQYNIGTVFQLTPPATKGSPWTETMLYSFGTNKAAGQVDGDTPMASVILDKEGNLYGTTVGGGTNSSGGTIFELSPPATPGGSWTFSVLFGDFLDRDGHSPLGLTFGWEGSLYGTNGGNIYRLTNVSGTWSLGVIYKYPGAVGTPPYVTSTLLADKSGNLYGETFDGGTGSVGTVFELSPPSAPGAGWTETTLHEFTGAPSDGQYPDGHLIFDSAGDLYGETIAGGSGTGPACPNSPGDVGCGTVFELSPSDGSWTKTILYNFPGTAGQGWNPTGGLVFDNAGNLYGATLLGGDDTASFKTGEGTVFELSPPTAPGGNWSETILYAFGSGFEGKDDGVGPLGGVVFGLNGALYGTTQEGGNGAGYGTVFSVRP